MKSLLALLACFFTLPAFAGDIDNIRCVLNSHRWGDKPMRMETVAPSPTDPGGRVLHAVDYVVHRIEAFVRDGKKPGQLFATMIVNNNYSMSGTLFTPTAAEESELINYSAQYSIVCRAL